MTYDTVAQFSMVASLLLFVGLFLGILFYALFVAKRDQLNDAQRKALDLESEKTQPVKKP